MATIRKMRSKWQVIIRKKNYPTVVRSFIEKGTASKFAKDVETQMDKQIFQDLTGASTTTLKELMIKYRDEIVINLIQHSGLVKKPEEKIDYLKIIDPNWSKELVG